MSRNYIGLYYPFIHFKDDAWLKLTALYWDKMARIVPEEYGPTRDSDTVKQLAGELGFIEDVDPVAQAPELGEKFLALLQKHEDKLQSRYNVFQKDEWPDDPITQATAPPGTDPKLAYVFYEKMWDELQDALVQTSLALPHRSGDARWVGMHPKLASVYMAALAEEMARNRGYHPVTDETQDHLAVAGCTLERLAQALLEDVNLIDPTPTDEEIKEQMVRLAIQSVIPENITNVPTEKIIEIRKQHPGELANFQEYVQKLADELEELKIQNREHLERHLKMAFDKNIQPKLEELRQTLDFAGIKSTLGAMNVSMSLPSVAAVAAGVLDIADPIVTVAGIAFGVTTVLLEHRRAITNAMRQSPAAYLLRLERDLPPTNFLSWIANDTRKFFFGI